MDVILPLVIFFGLQKYTKPVYALLAASSPPLAMVIMKAVFFCTFDALGFLVFFTFVLSALVAIITRSPIFLLLEKSLVTLILSIVFTITLIPCPKSRMRPLAYYFYQDLVPTDRSQLGLTDDLFNKQEEQVDGRYKKLTEDKSNESATSKHEISEAYHWLYLNCPPFRHSCYFITIIWAIGYFCEFLARFILIITGFSVGEIVLYGHIILSTITAICIASTILTIMFERKRTLIFIERWKNLQIQAQPQGSSDRLEPLPEQKNCSEKKDEFDV